MAERTKYQITVDCNDPDRMARFWAAALGYELEGPPGDFSSWREYWLSVEVPEDELEDGYDSIVDSERVLPRIWFQLVPEEKTIKNRLHFDLLVGGGRAVPIEARKQRVDTAAAKLQEIGATQLHVMDSRDIGHYAIAMADPEGNEFDVV